jgi:hypothetical protein
VGLSSVACAFTLLWIGGCTAFSDPDSFASLGELCKSYCDVAVKACGQDEDTCSAECKKLAMGRLGDSIGDSAACRAGYAEKADPHTLACEGARLDAPLACNRRESSRCEAYCLWKALNCPLTDALPDCISDCEALRLAGEATSLDCAIEAARAGECVSASLEACSR